MTHFDCARARCVLPSCLSPSFASLVAALRCKAPTVIGWWGSLKKPRGTRSYQFVLIDEYRVIREA
jgi:hypothetical protein